jgi:phosphate transport system substrate-binding protein
MDKSGFGLKLYRNLMFGGIFIFINIIMITGSFNAQAAEVIRINGSGSALDMMKPLVEAYSKNAPGVSFEIEKPLGSSGAMKALLAGALDIAMTSKPLDSDMIAKGAKLRPFGKTPLAIVTQKDNPKKNITTKELEDIYSGTLSKWANGENIRIVLRPNEDIDTKILKGLSSDMPQAMEKAQKRRGMLTATTDPESNEAVAKTVGSIGASGLTGVIAGKMPLHVLTLNGIMPKPETIADGTYPLAKEIGFVTTEKLPQAAEKFVEFVYSAKGLAIAKKSGVLPLTGTK